MGEVNVGDKFLMDGFLLRVVAFHNYQMKVEYDHFQHKSIKLFLDEFARMIERKSVIFPVSGLDMARYMARKNDKKRPI